MKVVINKKHGGFGLSREAYIRYGEIKGMRIWIEEDTKFKSLGLFTAWKLAPEDRIESKEGDAFYSMNMEDRQAYNKQYSEQTMYCRNIERNDPALVQTVEELGKRANGSHADLKVVEIPDGVEFQIEEYDGLEWVAEVHKTWS